MLLPLLLLLLVEAGQALQEVVVEVTSENVLLHSPLKLTCIFRGGDVDIQYVTWSRVQPDKRRTFVFEYDKTTNTTRAYNGYDGRISYQMNEPVAGLLGQSKEIWTPIQKKSKKKRDKRSVEKSSGSTVQGLDKVTAEHHRQSDSFVVYNANLSSYIYTSDVTFGQTLPVGQGSLSLLIHSTRLSDDGVYECTVKCKDLPPLSHARTVNVIVLPSQPHIDVEMGGGGGDRNLYAGGDVSLRCSTNVGKPASTLSWYRRLANEGDFRQIANDYVSATRTRHQNDTTSVDSAYSFQLTANDDGAVYRCVVDKPRIVHALDNSRVSADKSLAVQYPAEGVSIFASGANQFVCQARGNPPPVFVWLMLGDSDKTVITTSPQLDLAQVTANGQFRFLCMVSNVVNGRRHEESRDIELNIKDSKVIPLESTTTTSATPTTLNTTLTTTVGSTTPSTTAAPASSTTVTPPDVVGRLRTEVARILVAGASTSPPETTTPIVTEQKDKPSSFSVVRTGAAATDSVAVGKENAVQAPAAAPAAANGNSGSSTSVNQGGGTAGGSNGFGMYEDSVEFFNYGNEGSDADGAGAGTVDARAAVSDETFGDDSTDNADDANDYDEEPDLDYDAYDELDAGREIKSDSARSKMSANSRKNKKSLLAAARKRKLLLKQNKDGAIKSKLQQLANAKRQKQLVKKTKHMQSSSHENAEDVRDKLAGLLRNELQNEEQEQPLINAQLLRASRLSNKINNFNTDSDSFPAMDYNDDLQQLGAKQQRDADNVGMAATQLRNFVKLNSKRKPPAMLAFRNKPLTSLQMQKKLLLRAKATPSVYSSHELNAELSKLELAKYKNNQLFIRPNALGRSSKFRQQQKSASYNDYLTNDDQDNDGLAEYSRPLRQPQLDERSAAVHTVPDNNHQLIAKQASDFYVVPYSQYVDPIQDIRRVEHHDKFDCTKLSDGAYGGGCRSFIRCQGGVTYNVDCRSPHVFNQHTGDCDKPENVQGPCGQQRDCSQSPNRKYPDRKMGCHYYYTCENGVFLGVNQCNDGLLFNVENQVCDWPHNVAAPCGTAQ